MCVIGDHGAPLLSSSSSSDRGFSTHWISLSLLHQQPQSPRIAYTCYTCSSVLRGVKSKPDNHHASQSTRAFQPLGIYPPTLAVAAATANCVRKSRITLHLILVLLLCFVWKLNCASASKTTAHGEMMRQTTERPCPYVPYSSSSSSSSRPVTARSRRSSDVITRIERTPHNLTTSPNLSSTPTRSHLRTNLRTRDLVYGHVDTVEPPVPQPPTGRPIVTDWGGFSKPEWVDFVCHRLPDPCARAAYLRQHRLHTVCSQLSLLYLLPYVTGPTELQQKQQAPQRRRRRRNLVCRGGSANLAYIESDGLFEPWLQSSTTCEESLITLLQMITSRTHTELDSLDGIMTSSFCKRPSDMDFNRTGEFRCDECLRAYTDWLCVTEFPPYYPLVRTERESPPLPKHPPTTISTTTLPSNSIPRTLSIADSMNNTSRNPSFRLPPSSQPRWSDRRPRQSSMAWPLASSSIPTLAVHERSWTSSSATLMPSSSSREPRYAQSLPPSSAAAPAMSQSKLYDSSAQTVLIQLKPCSSWCTQVETLCPYLNPIETASNGGEPAFLCHESHYHHSSQYRNIYGEKVKHCETECCVARTDFDRPPSSDPLRNVHGDTASGIGDADATEKPCLSLSQRCHDPSATKIQPPSSSSHPSLTTPLSTLVSTDTQTIPTATSSATTHTPISLPQCLILSLLISLWVSWHSPWTWQSFHSAQPHVVVTGSLDRRWHVVAIDGSGSTQTSFSSNPASSSSNRSAMHPRLIDVCHS